MRVAMIAVALVAMLAVVQARSLTENDYQSLFSAYVKQHNKVYPHDEFFGRYNVFKANYDIVRAHNKGNHTYTLAVNEFADLTVEEFSDRYLGLNPIDNEYMRRHNLPHVSNMVKAAPASVDWREKAVTPIKNQAQCGSCWAFSTTGSVEGRWAIAKGQLVSLSEQQLVDCSGAQGNQGCNGGLMDQAFQFIITNKGICTEDSYPYTATTGTCQTTCTPAVTISGFKDVAAGSEAALQDAVAEGPVSIAIEADQSAFQLYGGGVFNAACGTQLDHGVLAVGYGHDAASNLDYWIVKNSWGNTWGESGYIRLVKGSNQCGLSNMASYPVV